MIEVKDIEKLAELSRINISSEEKEIFLKDMLSILDYVDQIKKAAGAAAMPPEEIGLKNILREDGPFHNPGQFTELLLDSAPEKEEGYIKVKKIL